MIYLKRLLKIVLAFITVIVFLFSIIITIVLYPFYALICYIIYGNFGKNLYDITEKIIDIIFKPLDFLEK